MQSQPGEILVPYGRTLLVPGDGAGPLARLVPGTMLRLADGPYPFAEPPDLVRLADTPARLLCLCEHLQSLCALWDKPARLFLEAYFARIAAALAADDGGELAALVGRAGGIFVPADWSFAAPRPLPQAHLAAGAGAPVRVDFAFWTGAGLVAIELRGSASPRRQRRDELARLAAAGIALVEVPMSALQQDGERLLARILPSPFGRFWHGVGLPASPFGPEALDEIVADQSVISRT